MAYRLANYANKQEKSVLTQAQVVNSRSRSRPSLITNSGPAVGMSQMYTSRIRELEGALHFLLGIPEVMAKVASLVRERGPVSADPA